MGARLWASAGVCPRTGERQGPDSARPSSWLLVSFCIFVAYLSAETQLFQLQEGMYPNLAV